MTYTLGETIYWKLRDDEAIVHVAYSLATGYRIYPVKMPDNVTYPAKSFQFIGGASRIHTMGSDTGNPSGTRLQISAWAETLTEARALQELVRLEMQDTTGTYAGGVTFQRIFTESEPIELYSDSAEVYQVIRDYLIWV